MTVLFTIQVSMHPTVFGLDPSPEALGSWKTIFSGELDTLTEARDAAKACLPRYRFVRLFKGTMLMLELDARQYRRNTP